MCASTAFGLATLKYPSYNRRCRGCNLATTRYSVLPGHSRASKVSSRRSTKSLISLFKTNKRRFILFTSLGSESTISPLSMGSWKRFLNSAEEPSTGPRTRDTMTWYSIRLFWRGVPVSATRRFVLTAEMTWCLWDLEFLRPWASSSTRTSGPGSCKQRLALCKSSCRYSNCLGSSSFFGLMSLHIAAMVS